MSTKPLPTDLPIHPFASAADFEAFLERDHKTSPGIYVKFAKKPSGIPSITGPEAVEVALCFGWIDGRGNGLGEDWWIGRYTPRRPKSMWSQKNVKTYERLQVEGRLRPAGIAAAEAAKADGRWDRAYAGPATMTAPDDLAAALAAQPAAKAFFDGLNKRDWYSVVWRVHTGSLHTRAKRIDALVQNLALGKLPSTTAYPKLQPEEELDVKKIAFPGRITKPGHKKKANSKSISTHTKSSKSTSTPTKKVNSIKSNAPLTDSTNQPRRAGLRRRP